jgi:hypothetical protein
VDFLPDGGILAATEPREASVDLKVLHAKIGELTLENDFFLRRARQGRPAKSPFETVVS